MRLWMIEPKYLCRKHLLGEHGEIHKHRHNFEKHHTIRGRIFPITQIEPESMESRHNELAKEMLRRGMNHKSPYSQPDLSYLPNELRYAKVNRNISIYDLSNRCEECRRLISKESI